MAASERSEVEDGTRDGTFDIGDLDGVVESGVVLVSEGVGLGVDEEEEETVDGLDGVL